MKYNLEIEYDRERFAKRAEYFLEKKCCVELSEHKPKRSLKQNAYLHLLLQCLALELGETVDYVKDEYYKKECNRDLLIYQKWDDRVGRSTERKRSSSDLTSEEMSLSIDRLKTWASAKLGIYLPDAEKPEELVQAYQQVDGNKQWL